ncbi:MAG TPA: phosphoenolpyruvate kinase [Candidatus Eisenbacteria bacterium]
MDPALTPQNTREILHRLSGANLRFAEAYPGDRADRQPVHTVYGGAHLFAADVAARLGAAALRSLEEYAPDPETLARAIGLPGCEAAGDGDGRGAPAAAGARDKEGLARAVYARVIEKLKREPVEDYRIDFEDGYGNRPDAEEDGHAAADATELARGMRERTLPPFIGIRIKPLSEELRGRALRTLDLFVGTLVAKTRGALPGNFVITIPKITSPEQVTTVVEACELIERARKLAPGSLRLELMVETTQSIFAPDGALALPRLVAAARGRCRGAHFGTYDYTAGVGITAMYQLPSHLACDFARHVMQVSLAGTGVTMSDGATTVMPVGPHRAARGEKLTAAQLEENRRAVHHAWRIHYQDVRSSLRNAYYQGWDLNPGQLPTRYAAVFAFFLESRAEAGARLKAFVDKAAQATLLGSTFDDAATGQGLLNFFLRGLSCGALTEEEALATGLTLEELRGRSFVKMLNVRRAAAAKAGGG